MATLYNKYRSRTFDEVIGQEPIVTTLVNQIKLGRIGHAYLFTGSRGIGKTSCARIFARAVNCLHPKKGSPCGECEVCKALAAPDSIDIVEMDAASNNGVDDARDIREKVKYLPVACKYRVYIIDEVHMLTGGAFNALLKTLEEPPEHVIFILATTEPQKLPQTILSRCIRFDFRLVPSDVLAKHIARVYDAEGIKYTTDAVDEIARLGEGSVRDALSIADTIASAADKVTVETVLALTGAGETGAIAALFDCVAAKDVAGVLGAVGDFAARGKSMDAVCDRLTSYARNALVIKSVGREKAVSAGLVNADRAALDSLERSAANNSVPDISRILEHFSAAASGLRYSVNPRVYLETALIKLIYGADEDDDIRKRVSAIERKLSASPLAGQKKNIATDAPTVENKMPDAPHVTAEKRSSAPPPVKPDAQAQNRSAAAGGEKSIKPAAPTQETKAAYEPAPPPVDYYEPEPPPDDGYSAYDAPVQKRASGKAAQRFDDAAVKITSADAGEFRHFGGSTVTGRELMGRIVRHLRKKKTREAARAYELISRGVLIKEREDAIAFVTPDSEFLSVSDSAVVAEFNAALDALGIKKRARVDKTAEDLFADDVARARELFGRDSVFVNRSVA